MTLRITEHILKKKKPGKDQLSLKSKTEKNKRGFIKITKASYIDTDNCKVDYTNISVISNSLWIIIL